VRTRGPNKFSAKWVLKMFLACAPYELGGLHRQKEHSERTLSRTLQSDTTLFAMSSEKRPASDAFGSSQMVVKRPNLGNGKAVAVVNGTVGNGALISSVPRTSGLQAPVMELTGHSGEVFAARFNPEGNYIASGSMDRSISWCSCRTILELC
jgi:hypothetical protein